MYNIVFAGDDKYIKYIAVAIASIVKSTDKTKKIKDFQIDSNKEVHGENFISNENLEDVEEGYYFHILTDFIQEETKAKLKGLEEELSKIFPIKIDYYELSDKEFRGFPTWRKSYLPYYRFKIDKIIAENVQKVLYLDGDMLICSDIRQLFAIDIENENILAVLEGYKKEKIFEKLKFASSESNNTDNSIESLVFTGDYFNSGLLLANIKNWKKNKISEKCMQIMQNYHLSFPDQDALNIILKDYKKLPAGWNMILGSSLNALKKLADFHKYELDSQEMYNLILKSKNIGIIHYSIKPWVNLGYRLTNTGIDLSYSAFINLWWEEAKEVPYFKEDLLAIKQTSKYLKGIEKDKKLLALSTKPMAFKVFVALNNVNRKFQPSIRKVEKPIKQFRNKMRAKFAK